MTTEQKKKKKKGPIRFEAILPVLIISLITFGYFSFYFDLHMKKLIEYVGMQANGAEVNVGKFSTSFIKGSLNIDHIQVTNPEKPTQNSIEIGNIHFKYLWDAILRMKFVVEDASIKDIKIASQRKRPGKVLPPQPAKPSKMEALQLEVTSQIKNKYNANVLGNIAALLQGEDYTSQIQAIRDTLKSEKKVQEMTNNVNQKKSYWDGKVKELSDTSKIKEAEKVINEIKNEKNFLAQAQAVQKLTKTLDEIQKQYKEVEKASSALQSDLKMISAYPKELQQYVNEDIASLKNRFSIPQVDFKDMAMNLFAGEFAEHIAKARKYQALADQYLPEKKEPEAAVIPPPRSAGKNYEFPITTGYPLFWLKKAAISSKGTPNSYSGDLAGELTNVTTSPKLIKKPVILDVKGNFPDLGMSGVHANIKADYTRSIPKQSAKIEIARMKIASRNLSNSKELSLSIKDGEARSSIEVQLEEQNFSTEWKSTINRPEFLVESSSKLAKEMVSNILQGMPFISIDGSAKGTFKNFKMDISSNLGTELGKGISKEIGSKVNEAQAKLNSLVEEKINKPKKELLSSINSSSQNLKQLSQIQDLYKANEGKIQQEIEKLKKGGGKNLLKGIKL